MPLPPSSPRSTPNSSTSTLEPFHSVLISGKCCSSSGLRSFLALLRWKKSRMASTGRDEPSVDPARESGGATSSGEGRTAGGEVESVRYVKVEGWDEDARSSTVLPPNRE